jgi:hypothetical protein
VNNIGWPGHTRGQYTREASAPGCTTPASSRRPAAAADTNLTARCASPPRAGRRWAVQPRVLSRSSP